VISRTIVRAMGIRVGVQRPHGGGDQLRFVSSQRAGDRKNKNVAEKSKPIAVEFDFHVSSAPIRNQLRMSK
jgi:hypothetical protein